MSVKIIFISFSLKEISNLPKKKAITKGSKSGIGRGLMQIICLPDNYCSENQRGVWHEVYTTG